MKLLYIILLSLFLSACGSTPVYNRLEVKDTETKVSKIPDELLELCIPEPVISKEKYLKLKPHEREQYLTDYNVALLGVVKNCNDKLKKIKERNSTVSN